MNVLCMCYYVNNYVIYWYLLSGIILRDGCLQRERLQEHRTMEYTRGVLGMLGQQHVVSSTIM